MYSTGNCIQYLIIIYNGKRILKRIYIYIYIWITFCMPKTNTTLWITYISTFLKSNILFNRLNRYNNVLLNNSQIYLIFLFKRSRSFFFSETILEFLIFYTRILYIFIKQEYRYSLLNILAWRVNMNLSFQYGISIK